MRPSRPAAKVIWGTEQEPKSPISPAAAVEVAAAAEVEEATVADVEAASVADAVTVTVMVVSQSEDEVASAASELEEPVAMRTAVEVAAGAELAAEDAAAELDAEEAAELVASESSEPAVPKGNVLG